MFIIIVFIYVYSICSYNKLENSHNNFLSFRFPPEVVTFDITGKNFERMSHLRRSMINSEYDDTVRRRTKTRKPRGKRRNTIAGTDTKELAAIVG